MNRSILVVVLAMCCAGVAQSAPIAGVVVSYDKPDSGPWVAHLVNLSHKYVTSVDIGITRPGQTTPVSETTFNWANDGFAPGATKDVRFGPGKETDKVAVDVVVYADLTAESTNDRALQKIIEQRQRALLTDQKINEVIAKSASPQQAATELEKLADAVPEVQNAHTLKLYPSALRGAAENLRNGVDPQEIVKRHAESIETHQHDSEITKVN
jgi:hypothetical protein